MSVTVATSIAAFLALMIGLGVSDYRAKRARLSALHARYRATKSDDPNRS